MKSNPCQASAQSGTLCPQTTKPRELEKLENAIGSSIIAGLDLTGEAKITETRHNYMYQEIIVMRNLTRVYNMVA